MLLYKHIIRETSFRKMKYTVFPWYRECLPCCFWRKWFNIKTNATFKFLLLLLQTFGIKSVRKKNPQGHNSIAYLLPFGIHIHDQNAVIFFWNHPSYIPLINIALFVHCSGSFGSSFSLHSFPGLGLVTQGPILIWASTGVDLQCQCSVLQTWTHFQKDATQN